VHRRSPKENTSPKPLTGIREELIIMSFYNQQSSKTEVLEVCAMAGVEPNKHSSAAVDKEGRGPGTV